METYEYRALRLVQQPSAPPFFVISAPADELLEWCDVPRAKGDYMAGYQRALQDKRVEDIANYLRLSPNNVIPGAVIVAVDIDHVTINEVHGADGLYSVSIAEDTRDFETKVQELWGSFTTRLADEEAISAGLHVMSGTPAVDDGGTSTDEPGPATDPDFVETDDTSAFGDEVELIEEIEDSSLDEDEAAIFLVLTSPLSPRN